MSPVRNAWAAVALLVGLGAVVGVPAAIAAVLPDEGPMPPGDRLDVGFGVSMIPPSGARLSLDDARPGSGDVTFRSGAVTVTVTAVDVVDRPAEFVAHTRRKFSRDDGLTPGPAAPWRLAGGILGERGDLRAADGSFTAEEFGSRPGCYAVAVADQLAAVVVMSPVEGCAAVPPEIWTAVGSLTFVPEEGL